MTRDDRGTALFLPLSLGRHKLYIDPWENENKQLLGEEFLISEIMEAEPKAEADNIYRDLEYLGYHKNRI